VGQTDEDHRQQSAEIIVMLNSEFNEFAKQSTLDLYPEQLREEQGNEKIYHSVNNGVYRCGFAPDPRGIR